MTIHTHAVMSLVHLLQERLSLVQYCWLSICRGEFIPAIVPRRVVGLALQLRRALIETAAGGEADGLHAKVRHHTSRGLQVCTVSVAF